MSTAIMAVLFAYYVWRVIRFKPGYTNRRINVTLLYGERDPDKAG